MHSMQLKLPISDPLVKAINLSKVTNDKVIIDDVNFTANKAMLIGLLGASGAGKTTLLNIIGLMDNYSGELYLLGENVKTLSAKAKIRNENMGFIFQSHFLLNELNILENILLPSLLTGKKGFDPEYLLNETCLAAKKYAVPCELSAGELQRAAFARAIINKPNILLADEPTGNLDKKNKIKIFELLKDYAVKYSAAVIVASHDDIIKDYADQIMKIEDGKLIK